MSLRGARIKDYEVWGLLGEGGMSEVWLAKHEVLAMPVVLKTLRESVAASLGENGRERLREEARLLARVTSSRVVRALDAGQHEGLPYFVQEYVDGIDLAELDRRRRTALGVGLPLWFVCEVMRQIAHALHAAHQTGIVHRDVKPSNLFAAPETGIRLGDFGIAVARTHAASRPELTGTLRFMAPELLESRAAAGRGTDVYGAGATAYDLRYGTPPWTCVEDACNRSKRVPFPEPASPAEAYFQKVVLGMLEKDADARYQDIVTPRRHFDTLADAVRPEPSRRAFVHESRNAFRFGDAVVELVVGDLADSAVDAIIASASYTMEMRSGSGDALRRRGGDRVEEEAMKDGEHALGSCVATGAGTLLAKHVLHAVSAWNETSCVGRAMQRALLLADELGHRTLAAPALGTGTARVTMETCASAMMTTVKWHLALGGSRLSRLTVVLPSEEKLRIFREVAVEALTEGAEVRGPTDVGLRVLEGEVKADAVTQLDTARR